MKKLFLLTIATAVCVSSNAQNARTSARNFPAYKVTHDVNAKLKANDNTPSTVIDVKKHKSNLNRNGGGNHTSAVGTIALGTAASGIGVSGNSRSNLAYNKDVNTIVFTHRSNATATGGQDPNTGFFRVDISKDGGATWAADQGPIYGTALNQGNIYRGRYPEGVIYNPTANTNANNCFDIYGGPWNTGTWYGEVYGAAKMDFTAPTEHFDSLPLAGGLMIFPENSYAVQGGNKELWRVGEVYDVNAATFQNSIGLYEGQWNGSNDVNYILHQLPHMSNVGLDGVYDMDIAFGDNGMVGYVAVIGAVDNYVHFPDSTNDIIIYKTTDGGCSWYGPIQLDIKSAMDAQLGNSGDSYGTAFDLDIAVDKNNNLHVMSVLAPCYGYSIYSLVGYFGLVDFYTTDQGTTWAAQLLGKPETFRGNYGEAATAVSEDSRPGVSRTWDGNKMFFTWFDTDTITFGITTNDFPDMHVAAYDVTSGKWTAEKNLTGGGTAAEGFCRYGNVADHVADNAGVYTIPVVVQELTTVSTSPTQFHYISGLTLADADFTVTGTPVAIPTFTDAAVTTVTGCFTSINDVKNTASFSVSANYPNPFSGKTMVDVNLMNASDVTIEVSNMVGQIMSTNVYRNLNSGVNSLTIDGSTLAKGIYIYKVKAGNEVVTKTMNVQ